MARMRSMVVALLLVAGLSACAASVAEQREAALSSYVAAERETLDTLLASTGGTYSDIQVAGHIEGDPDDERSTAVVQFTYRYSAVTDFATAVAPPPWEVPRPSWLPPLIPYSQLVALKDQLRLACNSTVIAAMRDAGVTGPLRIEYVYLQPISGTSWDGGCFTNAR